MVIRVSAIVSDPDEKTDPVIGDKIRSLQELQYIAASERAAGNRVVLCHGVFDLLHMGHVRHLKQARGNGERLIVTIIPDRCGRTCRSCRTAADPGSKRQGPIRSPKSNPAQPGVAVSMRTRSPRVAGTRP